MPCLTIVRNALVHAQLATAEITNVLFNAPEPEMGGSQLLPQFG
jgi:hypothetical protein